MFNMSEIKVESLGNLWVLEYGCTLFMSVNSPFGNGNNHNTLQFTCNNQHLFKQKSGLGLQFRGRVCCVVSTCELLSLTLSTETEKHTFLLCTSLLCAKLWRHNDGFMDFLLLRNSASQGRNTASTFLSRLKCTVLKASEGLQCNFLYCPN